MGASRAGTVRAQARHIRPGGGITAVVEAVGVQSRPEHLDLRPGRGVPGAAHVLEDVGRDQRRQDGDDRDDHEDLDEG